MQELTRESDHTASEHLALCAYRHGHFIFYRREKWMKEAVLKMEIARMYAKYLSFLEEDAVGWLSLDLVHFKEHLRSFLKINSPPSASQTSRCIIIPRWVLLNFRFQFYRCGLESQILHFWQVLGWWWQCWSMIGEALRKHCF